MGFTAGTPLPNITETTTTTANTPDWYTNIAKDLSSAGTTAMKRTAGESIAGLDPYQTKAYLGTEDAAAAYKSGLTSAEDNAKLAAQGMTPDLVNRYMNMYTPAVVGEMGRLSNQNLFKNVLPAVNTSFVGTGALGSRRNVGALGQAIGEAQSTLTGQQYGALSKGFDTALQAAKNQADLVRLGSTNEADIAKTAQTLNLNEMDALNKMGLEKQKYEQSLLDAPLATAKNAADLLRGYTLPKSDTITKVGPGQAGQYGKSQLETIAGLTALVGSAQAGRIGEWLFGKAASGNNAATQGVLSGFLGGGNKQTVDSSQFIGAGADGSGLYYNPTTGTYYNSSGNTVGVNWQAEDWGTGEDGSTTGYGAEGGAGAVP
jgi:hypothetical protein